MSKNKITIDERPDPKEKYAIQIAARGGMNGPLNEIACVNCDNRLFEDVTLKQYHAGPQQIPSNPQVSISAVNRTMEWHILRCPVCQSLIIPYDDMTQAVHQDEWEQVLRWLAGGVSKLKGKICRLRTKRQEPARLGRGSNIILGSDLGE